MRHPYREPGEAGLGQRSLQVMCVVCRTGWVYVPNDYPGADGQQSICRCRPRQPYELPSFASTTLVAAVFGWWWALGAAEVHLLAGAGLGAMVAWGVQEWRRR